MKRCKKCGAEKPLSEFYKHHSNRDGFSGHCKDCHIAYVRGYQARKKFPDMSESEREFWIAWNRVAYGTVLAGPRKSPVPKMHKVCHGCLSEMSLSCFDKDPMYSRRRFNRCQSCQRSLEPCKKAGCKSCVKRQSNP
jgi:hypothetical protein